MVPLLVQRSIGGSNGKKTSIDAQGRAGGMRGKG
jgi:hypothetical protein